MAVAAAQTTLIVDVMALGAIQGRRTAAVPVTYRSRTVRAILTERFARFGLAAFRDVEVFPLTTYEGRGGWQNQVTKVCGLSGDFPGPATLRTPYERRLAFSRPKPDEPVNRERSCACTIGRTGSAQTHAQLPRRKRLSPLEDGFAPPSAYKQVASKVGKASRDLVKK
jgi:hypothetical protein